jgi:hypothetical protein
MADDFDVNDDAGEPVVVQADPMAGTDVPVDGLSLEERKQFLRDLKEAYYSGSSRIKFRERDVTFRSAAEMRKILDQLEAEIRGRRQKHVGLTTFGRGY